MDIKRIALIVALAGVAYAMIIQWNTDYGRNGSRVSPQPQVAQDSMIPPLPNDPLIQASTAGSSRLVDSDIPPVETQEEALPEQQTPVANFQYIRVKTDNLDLLINPLGGDVESTTLLKHLKNIENPDEHFVLLEKNSRRTYVAQSGLIGKNGIDNQAGGRPLFHSSQPSYILEEGKDSLDVTLSYSSDNVQFQKVFHFTRSSYRIDVEYIITNQSDKPWQGNLFAQIKRDRSELDDPGGTPMGVQPFMGAAYWTEDKPYVKFEFDDFHDEPIKQISTGGWVAFLQHYFVNAWVAPKESSNTYSSRINSRGEYIIGFTVPAMVVQPGQNQSVTINLFSGPKDQDALGELSPGLDLTMDYGLLWFVGQPIFHFMSFIHSFVGNWGLAIIILTFCLKLLFYPLSAKSFKSMANMRRVQPEMTRLKELHGDDKQALSQSMMELYRKEKVNPLGGCLPILVQMPVFISLYWVIMESVELRHAPFMLWIDDMSVMDPYFVLPIIMGITMFIQQSLNPTPADPMQAKVMKMMPIGFTFMFMWFPSGLVLYWVVNNTLSIIQQYIITKRIGKAGTPAG
ncbi:MAG: membrane protein insertase YidC [Pseudomonadales bacterium]|nr:membrane protein insertase YidC [Pseudomonadales bacterium]